VRSGNASVAWAAESPISARTKITGDNAPVQSLLLAAILAVGVQGNLEASHEPTTPEPPAPSVHGSPSHNTVLVRKCVHDPWQKQGCCNCVHDAQEAAKAMQALGLLVMIR
jgi:hypothetical protein